MILAYILTRTGSLRDAGMHSLALGPERVFVSTGFFLSDLVIDRISIRGRVSLA